jgi:hypothetical protein
VDNGNYRCTSCVDEKEQTQTNPCATGTTRWVAGGSACNRTPNYSSEVGIFCDGAGNNSTVYQNTNSCFTGNQFKVGLTTYSYNPSTGPCGFPITLYGRGNSIGNACSAAGEKTVYVGTEQIQSDYNNFGFGFIEGVYLFENIYLSSLVADPYAADNNLNVYAINSGVVGAFTFPC